MRLQKEEYARKRIHNGCLVRIDNSVTRDNCSASQGLPRVTLVMEFSIRTSQPLKILTFMNDLSNQKILKATDAKGKVTLYGAWFPAQSFHSHQP